MTARAARWLEAAGAKVARDAAGAALHPIEISPRTALSADDLRGRIEPGLEVKEPTAL
jgi:hypothetical protein